MISLEIVRFTSGSSYASDLANEPPTPPIIIDFHATVDKTALGASLGTLCGPNGAQELSKVEP